MHDGWITWREQGPLEQDAPGEPVLMIMGLGASSRLWFRLLPWIARRHRAIVFDNRGTGDSSPVRGRLSMRGLAHDARAVLDDAGVESAHVIGASMGGMIAQHLALEDRDRVRSLTLACTTPGGRERVTAVAPVDERGPAPACSARGARSRSWRPRCTRRTR